MTNDVPITPEGLEAVRRELHELTTVKRPNIVGKIKAARELGDLSENFEYHAAKNEQGMMEARINELESIIKNHVLIEGQTQKGVVAMGSSPAEFSAAIKGELVVWSKLIREIGIKATE